jgi:hypothetical protein
MYGKMMIVVCFLSMSIVLLMSISLLVYIRVIEMLGACKNVYKNVHILASDRPARIVQAGARARSKRSLSYNATSNKGTGKGWGELLLSSN